MAKKLLSKDSIEQDFFKDPRQSAESFLTVVKDLKTEYTDFVKIASKKIESNQLKTAQDVKELNTQMAIQSESIRQIQKLEKQEIQLRKELRNQNLKSQKLTNDRLKLEKRLQEANSDQIQSNEEIKVQLQAQQKENKRLAREKLGLIGAYERESKKLIELRTQYKNLAADNRENTTEGQALLEQITALDKRLKDIDESVGQNQRSVGAYTKGVIRAVRELKENREAILVNIEALEKQRKATGLFNRGSKELREELDKYKQELKELNEELKDYGEESKEAEKETNAFADAAKSLGGGVTGFITGLLASGLAIFIAQLTTGRREQRLFEAALDTLTLRLRAIAQLILDNAIPALSGLIDVFPLIGKSAQLAFANVENAIKGALNTFAEIDLGKLGTITLFEPFEKENTDELEKNVDELLNSVQNGFKATGNIISGVYSAATKEIKPLFDALLEIEIREDRLQDQRDIAIKQINQLVIQEQLLSQAAGDGTISFQQQIAAQEDLIQVQEKRFKLELDLAKQAQQIAVDRARLELEQLGISEQFTDQQIASLEVLKDVNAADDLRIETIDKLREALMQVNELENEQSIAAQENAKIRREINRDIFERQLDFAIDAFDAQKTANERLIANEQLTAEERFKIFRRTQELTEKAFANQIKLVQDFTKQEIDLRSLAAEEDEEVIRKRLSQYQLEDVTLGRILEIIRERKAVTADLVEAERDVNDALRNQLGIINDIEQAQFEGEIATQQRRIDLDIQTAEKLIENQKKVSQERIDIINKEIDTEFDLRENQLISEAEFELSNDRLKAAERELIEQELQNNLEALERERYDKKIDLQEKFNEANKNLNKEQLEDAKELLNNIVDLTIDAIDRRQEARIKAAEDEISEREKNIDRQQSLAERGLENQLDFEIRKQDEAELQKRQLEEEKVKREKRIAYFKAFSAFLEDNPNTAASKALAQVLAAETIAGFFRDGVEGFNGKGGPRDDKNIVAISNGESILTAKGTDETPGLATAINENGRAGAMDWLIRNSGLGLAINQFGKLVPQEQRVQENNETLVREIRSLKKAIQHKKELHVSWNSLDERVEKLTEYGMRKVRKVQRKPPRI